MDACCMWNRRFFFHYNQLMLISINQLLWVIPGAVFNVSLWPDVWPCCDCSLGWGEYRPHRTGSCSPTEQTVLSSVPLPSIPGWILAGSLGASNNCYYVECGLSWDNTVTRMDRLFRPIVKGKYNLQEFRVILNGKRFFFSFLFFFFLQSCWYKSKNLKSCTWITTQGHKKKK